MQARHMWRFGASKAHDSCALSVEVIDGYAKLVDAHTVDIDGKKVTAETILVAVGGWPMMPKVEGGELAITSNEAFFLEERPKRVVVVGGGYIALEFAHPGADTEYGFDLERIIDDFVFMTFIVGNDFLVSFSPRFWNLMECFV